MAAYLAEAVLESIGGRPTGFALLVGPGRVERALSQNRVENTPVLQNYPGDRFSYSS